MKISQRVICLLALMGALLLWRCNSDRLTGYNYRASALPDSATVSGQVTHLFTGQPVHRASIVIQERIVESDRNGQYFLDYQIAEDDRLNRPAAVRISAPQFFSLDTSLIVFPGNNRLDVRLEYAAPIIQNSSAADTFITAQVFDYQGIGDVDSVFAVGTYWDDSLRVLSDVPFPLALAQIIDDNAAVFQGLLADSLGDAALLRTHYRIRAVDKSGFVGTRGFTF
jgi:hypothetical protein